jgi:hypothetical protein
MTHDNMHLHQISQEMQQCIQNCLDCHSICLNAIAYCLQQGGQHAEAAHIALMICVQWTANDLLMTHRCKLVPMPAVVVQNRAGKCQ